MDQSDRFYFFPNGVAQVSSRIVIRNQEQLTQLDENCDMNQVRVLYYINEHESPARQFISFSEAPSSLALDELEKSEPSNLQAAETRDRKMCCVCQTRCTEICHIIDKSVAFLLAEWNINCDSPNNIILLCPTHHTMFDRHEFVLVPATTDMDCWLCLLCRQLYCSFQQHQYENRVSRITPLSNTVPVLVEAAGPLQCSLHLRISLSS